MLQSGKRLPQGTEQIVMDTVGKSDQSGEQELDRLQRKRQLHSAKQAAEKSTGFLKLLVG